MEYSNSNNNNSDNDNNNNNKLHMGEIETITF